MPKVKGTKAKKYEQRKHALQSQPMMSKGVSEGESSVHVTAAVAPTTTPTENQTPIANSDRHGGGPLCIPTPYSMISIREALLETMAPVAEVPAAITTGWIDQSNPPPSPEWLIAGVLGLKKNHPHDNFQGLMRRNAYDTESGIQLTHSQHLQYLQAGSDLKLCYRWVPRICCHDCPGKLYLVGPETVDNFKTHLRNREHRKHVNLKINGLIKTCVKSFGTGPKKLR